MKTVHYTFTTWNEGVMAAGFDSGLNGDQRSALLRQSGETVRAREEDKVIDLTAWRAANQEELLEETDGLDWESVEPDWEDEELEPPAPRPRKSHRAMFAAELVSTLSVVAVAVALILRVLTF